ncbi:MAG: HYR domain-containing protein, partial [Bacteroidota bacterium]
ATIPVSAIPLPAFVDNCPDTTIQLSRLDGMALTDPYPKDTTVMQYILTDCGGLTDTCTFNIIVVDDEFPTITCPDNVVVDTDPGQCDAIVNFPIPTFADNCPDPRLSVERVGMDSVITPYPKGITTLIFTVTDCGDNETTCSITITVEDNEAPTCLVQDITVDVGDMITGADVDNGSFDNCTPVNLTVNPDVFGCDDVGVNVVDVVVSDTCGNSTMCTTNVTVLPLDVLELNCPPDTTVFVPADTCIAFVDLVATATGAVNITNDSPVAANNNSANASGFYPLGITIVTFIASDSCGNMDTCMTTVEVLDTIPPVSGSCGKVLVNLTDALVDTVTTDDIGPGQFFETEVMDNCSPFDSIEFAFDSLFTVFEFPVDCDDTGLEIVLPIYFRDESGNVGVCPSFVIGVTDIDGFCPNPIVLSVGGNIHTETGFDVSEAMVDISNPAMDDEMTDGEGMYMFDNLDQGNTYEIRPYKTDGLLDGISTYDIVLIQKHLLGLELLDSPFKAIAADINNSGSITALDMVNLRQAILGVRNDFPNNDSWRFVKDGFTFDDPYAPFTQEWPESQMFDPLYFNDMHVDFTAVKIGDVNTSWSPFRRNARSAEALWFDVLDQELVAGSTVKVPFMALDFKAILGYQFSLEFDQSVMAYKGFEAGSIALDLSNFGDQYIERGILNASWVGNPEGETYDNGEVLFYLEFEVKENEKLSNVLEMNSRILHSEIYQKNEIDETKELGILFNTIGIQAGYELYQNKPNPFNESTIIPFRLDEAGEAMIEIFNAEGKRIKSYKVDASKGMNQLMIYSTELKDKGVLYYTLSTPKFTASRKMIAY